MPKQSTVKNPSARRQKWERLVLKSQQNLQGFYKSANRTIDQYRIEQKSTVQQQKYNILYSNTETIKPSLYAQTPNVQVKQRAKDQGSTVARNASMLLEASLNYSIDDQDFDDMMNSVVEDYLLPGLGQAWVRYVPTMRPIVDEKGKVRKDSDGNDMEEVVYEHISFDFLHYTDFLWSTARRWSEVWWVAKGVYMDKAEVESRFGKEKAAKIAFQGDTKTQNQNETVDEKQTRIWEIWDKKHREVVWYCPEYPDDLLDVKPDFLRLRGFFPCPKPLRAVKTNNKFEPRPFYAQYQAQADELNDITAKIRKLVECLRVIGVYDASQEQLKNLLTGYGNKMVPVDNWAVMAEKGGLKGVVDYVPIQEVASVLMQLYDARERVKAEIYEITGWSDIIRGVSKASETLGAQQLKADWASSRLKLLQRDVQKFIRDLLRIGGELMAEHFSPETFLLISGLQFSDDEQEKAKQLGTFKQVLELLKTDKDRCALIDVETDSTIMPDEMRDRKERMDFLGAAGAFLQQAVPAMQTEPRLGQLLGEILMFTVRSFSASRPLEDSFEQFVQQMQQGGPTPPKQEGGGKDQGQAAQIKAQVDMQKIQVEGQKVQMDAQIQQAELSQETEESRAKLQLEAEKETNRHNEKMRELALREREVRVKEAELGLKADQQQLDQESDDVDRMLDQADKDKDRQLEQQENEADRQAARNKPSNQT